MYQKIKNDMKGAFDTHIKVLENFLSSLEQADRSDSCTDLKNLYYSHSELILASIVCAEKIVEQVATQIEVADRRNDMDAVAEYARLFEAHLVARQALEEYLTNTEQIVTDMTEEPIHKLYQSTYAVMLKIKKLCDEQL